METELNSATEPIPENVTFPASADTTPSTSMPHLGRQSDAHAMLKLEDVEVQVGRAVSGDFMRVVHRPTGISRAVGPPLRTPGKIKQQLLREIEIELRERGFAEHIVPDKRSRS
jgi:hypothetical protein